MRLKLSDTTIYEPQKRARLGTTVASDDDRWAMGVGGFAGLIYLVTMHRTLAGGDSGDLIANACRSAPALVPTPPTSQPPNAAPHALDAIGAP